MNPRHNLLVIFISVIWVFFCAIVCFGQEADQRSPLTPRTDPDQPKNVREMHAKLQIDQAKKEYEELLDRGQQALKISEDLDRVFSDRRALTQTDLEKLNDLEKIVKKIRGELGGDDGDDSDPESEIKPQPKSLEDGFASLQSLTVKLVDEIKKTSRFGVSAIAIQSSNAVLKIVRFLRFNK